MVCLGETILPPPDKSFQRLWNKNVWTQIDWHLLSKCSKNVVLRHLEMVQCRCSFLTPTRNMFLAVLQEYIFYNVVWVEVRKMSDLFCQHLLDFEAQNLKLVDKIQIYEFFNHLYSGPNFFLGLLLGIWAIVILNFLISGHFYLTPRPWRKIKKACYKTFYISIIIPEYVTWTIFYKLHIQSKVSIRARTSYYFIIRALTMTKLYVLKVTCTHTRFLSPRNCHWTPCN